jgi:hypothetical protein
VVDENLPSAVDKEQECRPKKVLQMSVLPVARSMQAVFCGVSFAVGRCQTHGPGHWPAVPGELMHVQIVALPTTPPHAALFGSPSKEHSLGCKPALP